MTEPSALETIWLSPDCGVCERAWCSHAMDCGECGAQSVKYVLADRPAPAQGEPVAWRTLTGAATTDERTANIWRDVHGFTIEPLYVALPSSPAPVHGSLNSGESEPSVMPAFGAGEAISPADLAEECAKIAEDHVGMYARTGEKDRSLGYDEACEDIAKAIRDTYRCANE